MSPAVSSSHSVMFTLGWVMLTLLVAWTWRGLKNDRAIRGWAWWGLAAAVLLCCRWPMLWVQHQLNPDESQLIAGAITLRHDPVFWRSVDGGTAGPFDYYPLLAAAWAQGMASYAVARLIALATVFATIVFASEALAVVAGAAVARLVTLPALAAVAFTTTPDFTHYSTELMPALLLAAAGFVAVRQLRAPASGQLWICAVLLGSVPWAKLQAVPCAVGLWLVVAISEYRAGRKSSLGPLTLGALGPAGICLAAAALTGQTEHLFVPYVLNNLAYVGAPQSTWAEVAAGQWQNAVFDGYLALWIVGAGLSLVPLALARARAASPAARLTAGVAGLLMLLAIFSSLAPRRASAHHLQLLALPLLWLTGAALALAWPAGSTPRGTQGRLRLAGFFLGCALLPQIALRATGVDAFAQINAAGMKPTRRQLAELVQSYSSPGETLAVWGWRCSLYVEAGRPQATRQAQTEPLMTAGPLQAYFLRRYFDDFRAAQPPVFADAVGPGNFAYTDRARAHECFPPLRAWVHEKYTQVAELDGTRLYVRNDRLALSSKPPTP